YTEPFYSLVYSVFMQEIDFSYCAEYPRERFEYVYITGTNGNPGYYIFMEWHDNGYGRPISSVVATLTFDELYHMVYPDRHFDETHQLYYYVNADDFIPSARHAREYSSEGTLLKEKEYGICSDLIATREYRNDANNRLKSIEYAAPDTEGNVWYLYLNENWDNDGNGVIEKRGRVSRVKRQTPNADGEYLYRYYYYTDTAGRLKRISAYAEDCTTLIATRTYHNNDTNRIKRKILAAPDDNGNIEYRYRDEDWNGQGHGRIDRTKRETPENCALSHKYEYYADTGLIYRIKAYYNNNWTELVATYEYDSTGNLIGTQTPAAAKALQPEEAARMELKQSIYNAFADSATVPELADKPKRNYVKPS
ncbi:MAG: hypothetical protein ABIH57_02670, partial [Candidatus Omnitrophota bacterium]